MYSISYLRRQVDALQKRLKPVLAILKLRKLAMEFCDEFDEAAHGENSRKRDLHGVCMMFPHRVSQAGFSLGRGKDLVRYFLGCRDNSTRPRTPRGRLHPHPLGQERPPPPRRPLGAPYRRLTAKSEAISEASPFGWRGSHLPEKAGIQEPGTSKILSIHVNYRPSRANPV